MNIGELFVKVGLTGTSTVIKGLNMMTGALKESASAAFSLKGMLLSAAAVTGMERMTKAVTERAFALDQFASLTGESTDEIQRLQKTMNRFNVGAEDTAATITALQRSVHQMRMTGQVPKFFNLIGATKADLDRPVELLRKYQAYFKNNKKDTESFKSEVGREAGLAENMIYALKKAPIEWDKLAANQELSQKDIATGVKLNEQFREFWWNFQIALEKLVIKNGDKIIKVLEVVSSAIITFMNALVAFVDKSEALKQLGSLIDKLSGKSEAGARIMKVFEMLIGIVDKVLGVALGVGGELINQIGGAAPDTKSMSGKITNGLLTAADYAIPDALENLMIKPFLPKYDIVQPRMNTMPSYGEAQASNVTNQIYLNGEKLFDGTSSGIKDGQILRTSQQIPRR